MADHVSDASPLVPPSPITEPSEIDLEAGPGEQIQCRICLETDGRDFIAPCQCKGTAKYVHRECLDQWRAVKAWMLVLPRLPNRGIQTGYRLFSSFFLLTIFFFFFFFQEGFAFAHCTTCKAPYHLRVHVAADRKWRTLKFRFFVTRDIMFIFLAVQLVGHRYPVIASLAYLVCLIDTYQKSWLRLAWGFDSELSFYYICEACEIYVEDSSMVCYFALFFPEYLYRIFMVECCWTGALLFFALLGLSGCFITCYDRRVRNDLAQPCRELCLCCCQPGVCADCHLPGTLCMWTDCTTCFESCASTAGECGCLGGAGEAGLPLLFIMALIVLGLFTVIGLFYSVLVATMVGQRIWQRHYHILAKRLLTKEYVVEDVDGEMTGSDWSPPPLPTEHVQQLKNLGLL
ncbi:hypothetical protein SADUNF_Sadunf07G0076000 [Salix dunnii]|uniref:RING-CH-type domain-containing protein n=2 Tax=Salix TaxID=40685 RepID=A0A835K3N2_9ROSI|nr:hypothetical protein SADUNF_Sadunf07G0076000 [Salix dunnii]